MCSKFSKTHYGMSCRQPQLGVEIFFLGTAALWCPQGKESHGQAGPGLPSQSSPEKQGREGGIAAGAAWRMGICKRAGRFFAQRPVIITHAPFSQQIFLTPSKDTHFTSACSTTN